MSETPIRETQKAALKDGDADDNHGRGRPTPVSIGSPFVTKIGFLGRIPLEAVVRQNCPLSCLTPFISVNLSSHFFSNFAADELRIPTSVHPPRLLPHRRCLDKDLKPYSLVANCLFEVPEFSKVDLYA
jgi:hypothetical protein